MPLQPQGQLRLERLQLHKPFLRAEWYGEAQRLAGPNKETEMTSRWRLVGNRLASVLEMDGHFIRWQRSRRDGRHGHAIYKEEGAGCA
jgi:hypothetical protein